MCGRIGRGQRGCDGKILVVLSGDPGRPRRDRRQGPLDLVTPARWFTARAMTNSRSDTRLVRDHQRIDTVRKGRGERDDAAFRPAATVPAVQERPADEPPAEKRRSGETQFRARRSRPRAATRPRRPSPRPSRRVPRSGGGIGEDRADGEQVALDRHEHRGDIVARLVCATTPASAGFVDLTVRTTR